MAAVAMIDREPGKGGRGQTVRKPDGLSKQRISEARVVLQWAPELADAVLAGAESLDRAYAVAIATASDAPGAHEPLGR